MTEVTYRTAHKADATLFAEIDRTSSPEPAPATAFASVLGVKDSHAVLASRGAVPVGYCMFQLMPDAVGICGINVEAGHRRQGIGRALLDQVEAKARRWQVCSILHAVSERELDHQLFLKACGWKATEIVADGAGGEFDFYVFKKQLPGRKISFSVGIN